MSMNNYQKAAMKFAKFASFDYPFSGLAEEAGEVQGKLAKAQRKQAMSQNAVLTCLVKPNVAPEPWEVQLLDDLKKELGDCLWMIAACADVLGFTLDDVAQSNIDKLADRDSRGVICGNGDNR